MKISRLALPAAALMLAGCAHSAARSDLPAAPVIAPAPLARELPPAPRMSVAPVEFTVQAKKKS